MTELTRGQKSVQTKIRNLMAEGLTYEEAQSEYTRGLKEAGSKGGKKTSPTKGFGHPTHNPSLAGIKGGRISRRRKAEE